MQVGEAFVAIRPDTQGFGQELNQGISASAKGAAAALGAVIGGQQVVDFLRGAVDEASNLNEAVSLTSQTFGDSSAEILAFGETSAESIGLANSEALQFANNIGGLFVGLGSTREEAAGLSQDVLTLASDLASAKNLTGGTAEALERLQAGIVGEVEPLRRLGVSFNAAEVEARALAETGKSSATALTEGEKAAARYGIILEQLGAQGVVGDFQRTSGGLANQQRILNAEWQNAQAEIGGALLPAVLDLVGAIRDGLPAVTLLGDAFGTSASGASGLAQVLSLVARTVQPVNDYLEQTSAGVTNLSNVLGPAGELAQFVGVAEAIWGDRGDGAQTQAEIDALAAAMERLGVSVGPGSFEAFTEAVAVFAADNDLSIVDALRELGITGSAAADIMLRLGRTGADAGTAIGNLGAAAGEAQPSLDAQAEALTAVADAADQARDKLEALYGIQQTVDEATIDLQASTDELQAALADGGGFDVGTESGRENISLARENASAIREYTLSLIANGTSADDALAANDFLTGSLRRQLAAAGLLPREINALIETYGRVPRRVATDLEADSGPARRGVDDAVGYALGNWAGRAFTATLGINTGAVAGQLLAIEANVGAQTGGAVTLESASRSAPAPDASERPPVTVVVNAGTIVGDPESFARQLAPRVANEIDRYDRRGY